MGLLFSNDDDFPIRAVQGQVHDGGDRELHLLAVWPLARRQDGLKLVGHNVSLPDRHARTGWQFAPKVAVERIKTAGSCRGVPWQFPNWQPQAFIVRGVRTLWRGGLEAAITAASGRTAQHISHGHSHGPRCACLPGGTRSGNYRRHPNGWSHQLARPSLFRRLEDLNCPVHGAPSDADCAKKNMAAN